jgi:hypothetical protein
MLLVADIYGIVSLFVPLRYHWSVAALLPAALLTVTGVGYSLIIGGMTLMWKRIQMLQEGFLLLVMIFAISALPGLIMPGWFAGLGRMFPVTAAVASLYDVLIAGRPVTALWGTGGSGRAVGHHRRLPGRRHYRFPARRAGRQDPRHARPLLTTRYPVGPCRWRPRG